MKESTGDIVFLVFVALVLLTPVVVAATFSATTHGGEPCSEGKTFGIGSCRSPGHTVSVDGAAFCACPGSPLLTTHP